MDQELIAYLDERFRERARQTQEQFAAFREEVARQFASSREETNRQFAAYREEINQQFASSREEINQQFASSREETNQQFASSREETNQRFERIEARMEEGFRHNGVEIEGVHGQIRQVAEGVALANERLGIFQKETANKLEGVRAEMRSLVGGAFKEIRTLEARISGMNQQKGTSPLSDKV